MNSYSFVGGWLMCYLAQLFKHLCNYRKRFKANQMIVLHLSLGQSACLNSNYWTIICAYFLLLLETTLSMSTCHPNYIHQLKRLHHYFVEQFLYPLDHNRYQSKVIHLYQRHELLVHIHQFLWHKKDIQLAYHQGAHPCLLPKALLYSNSILS